MDFTVYDPINGRILRFGSAGDEERCLAQAIEGERVLVGLAGDDVTRFVDPQTLELADRPELKIEREYKIDRSRFEEVAIVLPEGTEIIFEGVSHPAQNELIFTTQKPGRFVFRLTAPFPYQEKEITIHAD